MKRTVCITIIIFISGCDGCNTELIPVGDAPVDQDFEDIQDSDGLEDIGDHDQADASPDTQEDGSSGCFQGDPSGVCAPGQICEGPAGLCSLEGAVGWCKRPEDDCEGHDEVCGCDGVTYEDDCTRQAANVWLDHRVECSPVRECGSGLAPCPDNYFCEYPIGDCGTAPDARGTCVHVPETPSCVGTTNSVCGCDGNTYGNICFLRAEQLSALHLGACSGQACLQGDPDGDCAPDEFCEGPYGACSLTGVIGWCQKPEDDCPAEGEDEVCGCDGVTYDNDCDRQSANVWLHFSMACAPDPECGPGLPPCPEGDFFCEFPMGDCGDSPDSRGICVYMLEDSSCDGPFYPVCGCDRVTYSNNCFRHGEEVSALHDGEC